MRNSIAAGRRMAARIVIIQVGIAVVVAMLCSLIGIRAAFAGLLGGLLVALGTALLAARLFSVRPMNGGLALTGLLTGMALKWIIILCGLYLLLVQWQLPPLPTIVGLTAALLGHGLGFKLKE